MTTAAPVAVSADDLLTMPDGDRFELVNGELEERNMSALSGWVGGEAFGRLREYSREHGGFAFGDGVGYRCYDDPDQVRKPDASFVRSARLAEIPDAFLTISPDLVVEVVSPTDRYREVEEKAEEYLEAGVVVVWVLNPSNRSVRIFRREATPVQLGPSDELTAEDILPGFRCRIADLFPNVSITKPNSK